MKIFRWGGLIGFTVFTALLVVVGFFFIDGWAKKGLEAAGFNVNGAEVNVGGANLTLSPLGFAFEDIEVANADKPTHNLLSLDKMTLQVNFPQLFLGNVRIEDVTVEGVEHNTERAKVAEVAEKEIESDSQGSKAVTAAKETIAAKAGQFPEPSEIVSAQTQNTKSAVRTAEDTIDRSKQKVDSSVEALPGDEDLAAYRSRIAEIKALELNSLENIQSAQKLVESVSKDVAQDKLAIEAVKLSVNNAVSDSRKAVGAVLDAPAEDWEQLKEDYPLNKESAVKVARLLLGEFFFERIDQARYWYEKASPWLARLKSDEPDEAAPERLDGQYIRFAHPNPTARFQMDNANLTFVADSWPWQLNIQDVSTHTGDLFKPTLLTLRRGEAGSEALVIDGRLDEVDGQSVDRFMLKGNGVRFGAQKADLAGTEINWTPSKANVTGELVSTEGNLTGNVTLTFPENQFTASGSSSSSRYLSQALAGIETFKVTINVSGTVSRPSFSVQSDLDNQLSSGLQDVARAQYEAWLKDVRAQLDAEVARLQAPVDAELAKLENQRDQIQARIDNFETEVENEIRSLESKVKEERQKLIDKAQAEVDAAKAKAAAELEAARKKAEAEKKAAEEAAKKAAEEKLKEEANKLKDKISF